MKSLEKIAMTLSGSANELDDAARALRDISLERYDEQAKAQRIAGEQLLRDLTGKVDRRRELTALHRYFLATGDDEIADAIARRGDTV